MPRAYIREPVADRLWRKVEKSTDGCWNWTGSISTGGYGQINTGGRGRPARTHRIAYESAYGPIPDGLWVLHNCDNRLCCRPDHLRVGTRAENVGDMVARGRQATGERHGHSRLTADGVREIRRRAAAGEGSRVIALGLGVTYGAVHAVLSGKTWGSVV